jgi:hypothetical protein
VGWQDRRRLPLCAGGSRVRARLYALIEAIRERRRKAFRVSPFAHHRLRQRPLARAAETPCAVAVAVLDQPAGRQNGQQTSEIAWLNHADVRRARTGKPHEYGPEPIVAHAATLEVACHAGGRGFESGRSDGGSRARDVADLGSGGASAVRAN